MDILSLRKSHFMLSYFHYAYIGAAFLLSMKLGHFLTNCDILEEYTMSGILTEKSRRVWKSSVDAIVCWSKYNQYMKVHIYKANILRKKFFFPC